MMTIDEAARELKRMYLHGAANREQALSVHLFGIKYAEQIAGMSLSEIVARAEISKTYATEIRKGINLAAYVTLRAEPS